MAGSIAACVTGVITAAVFWGAVTPLMKEYDTGVNALAFQGRLGLPASVSEVLGLSAAKSTVTGVVALGIVSLWAGVVASASEAVDLWGWDDNLTIPALCGAGLWGFLRIFG